MAQDDRGMVKKFSLTSTRPFSSFIAKNCVFLLFFLTFGGLKTFALEIGGEAPISKLHLTLLFGQVEAAQELLNRGEDPSSLLKSGIKIKINEEEIYLSKNSSPLHAVAISPFDIDHMLITKLVIRGTDVNGQDEQGVTPIWLAASMGKHKLVRFLMILGADPNIENNLGQTALYAAAIPDEDSLRPINWPLRLDTASYLLFRRSEPGRALNGHSLLYQLLSFLAEHPELCDKEGCQKLVHCLYVNPIEDADDVLELIAQKSTIPPSIARMVKIDLRLLSVPTSVLFGLTAVLFGAMYLFMPHMPAG